MEKIYLEENNENIKFMAATIPNKKCTCLNCGQCLWCLIFVPAVGVGVALALGAALSMDQG